MRSGMKLPAEQEAFLFCTPLATALLNGLVVLFVHLGRLAFAMNLLEIRAVDCLID